MGRTVFEDRRSELVAQKVIRNLEKRHMQAFYAKDGAEALEKALSLIPEGSSVGWGGSMSIEQIGLKDAVRQGNYTAIDRDTAADPAERSRLMRECLSADVFLMSTNALSEDGQLVNLDGLGNRVAALCFGPGSVIVIAGMNKLAKTLDDAVSRVRNYAAPVNLQRFEGNRTACRETGSCADCIMDGCLCSQLVITRNCFPAGRIKVILVGEELGF
ncbi:MAG: lactate utilization protein [Lachnospiraceae bacterium]|nr:lactate utilization protein [Lachnospiraceae bacterium]